MTPPEHSAWFSSDAFQGLAAQTIRNAPFAVCWVDRDGQVRYGNSAACALLRYSAAELCGQHIADSIPCLDARAWESVWKSLPTQEPVRREVLGVEKSGGVVPVAIIVTRQDLDAHTLAVVYMHALHPGQMADSVSCTPARPCDNATDCTDDWEMWLSAGGDVMYCSPGCKPVTGFCSEEFIADPDLLVAIAHPDDVPSFQKHCRSVHGMGVSAGHFDYRILTRSGQERWICHYCTPRTGPDGAPAGRRVLNRDITARKRIETALRESESRLHLALEVAQMGYWHWEIDTNRVHWSNGHEKLFGITIDEFGGTIDDVQRYVHPEDRDQGLRNLRRTLEDRAPFDNTYRVVHPGGIVRWLHSYGYLNCDGHDRPVHIFGITQDITERKRLEHILIQAAEREQKRLGQELHDGLCQDLKSIEIESILLEQQLRSRGAGEADRAAQLAARVNRSVSTAYAMAQGMIPVGFDEQGLGEALHRIVHQTRRSHPGLRLTADVQPDCFPPDRESAYHVFRIAQEALINAVRHSGATAIALSWGLCENRSGHVCLRVHDNGCGFSEMVAPASGMGLVVMRSRAESIGAFLDISQNPGGGTVVDCSLPAHRGDVP